MAGYNTVSEIVSFKKRAVVVPRVHPAAEQLVRARRFADLGLVRMLHPNDATPDLLAESVHTALCGSPPPSSAIMDFGGSDTFVREVLCLMNSCRPEAH